MRITPNQADVVKMLAYQHFGKDAEVWLFGLRADDGERGGDYDFLVETSLNQPDSVIEHKIAMIAELQSTSAFEGEKIDLIVKRRNSSFDMPIYVTAKKEGARL